MSTGLPWDVYHLSNPHGREVSDFRPARVPDPGVLSNRMLPGRQALTDPPLPCTVDAQKCHGAERRLGLFQEQ